MIKATPEEQVAWKAKADPIEREMKQINEEMKKLRGKDNPATIDQKQALMKKLEKLQEDMPEPLRSTASPIWRTKNRRSICSRAVITMPKAIASECARSERCSPTARQNSPENTAKPCSELAKWIVDPNNPLTARVMVNRIWHYHFGRGIVATPNDFGRAGDRPTHPELLDYLANEFAAGGFSVKRIHRLILNSNTYLQSSAAPSDSALKTLALTKDPENRLLWRFNRRRLEAEQIRDAILAARARSTPSRAGRA